MRSDRLSNDDARVPDPSILTPPAGQSRDLQGTTKLECPTALPPAPRTGPGLRRKRDADRPSGGPLDHLRHHTEPGMIVHTGDDLGLPRLSGDRVDQPQPADDVNLHSCIGPGRSNRTNDSLGRFRGRGWARPCRSRIRLIVRSDGTTIPWTGARSSCIRIRFDSHRGCFRRISARATSTAAVAWCGHDTGRCDPSASPATFPARYRPIQRCSVERDTPVAAATSVTVAPPAPPGPRPDAVPPPTTQPAPSRPPESRRPWRRRTQGGRNRPLSRINWRATVAHHPAQDKRGGSSIADTGSPGSRRRCAPPRVSSLRCGPRDAPHLLRAQQAAKVCPRTSDFAATSKHHDEMWLWSLLNPSGVNGCSATSTSTRPRSSLTWSILSRSQVCRARTKRTRYST